MNHSSFTTILIANRGEIACRIMRTAHALGYGTVAVFSDADADAPHVQMADNAVRLGPADASQSYLNKEKILDAAHQAGADAIHPGYGFLAENGDFARAVIAAGLVWIGPPPAAMDIMGHKGAAKRAMGGAVPLIPGYDGPDQSDKAFVAAAHDIGYPVMIKAAAGGGGRGMRLVDTPADLPAALSSARPEAAKAFGSGELLLEKAIIDPRHIEFQVFGDQYGHVIHLGERDCSIQRRHQKVIEEAPSPAVTPALRAKMGGAAVAAAAAVRYEGAGTVEFLLDQDDNFYFIEMNTRLQVEHPVTELITGLDLVGWQLRVAAGEPLPLTQDEVTLDGHALEARLYAETPENGFLPSTGTVWLYQPPTGEGVRVDDGLRSGQKITPYYDAMIAKIIAFGETRDLAVRRLERALRHTVVLGVDTNRRFLLDALAHPTFTAGEATTAFVADSWPDSVTSPSKNLTALAAVVLYHDQRPDHLGGWGGRGVTYRLGDRLVYLSEQDDRLQVTFDEWPKSFSIKVIGQADHVLRYEIGGVQDKAYFAIGSNGQLWLQCGRENGSFKDTLLAPAEPSERAVSGRVIAPMPGAVLRVDAVAGQAVKQGQPLLVLEAMKMEHVIVAPFNGIVSEVAVSVGQQMRPRELLATITPSPNPSKREGHLIIDN